MIIIIMIIIICVAYPQSHDGMNLHASYRWAHNRDLDTRDRLVSDPNVMSKSFSQIYEHQSGDWTGVATA